MGNSQLNAIEEMALQNGTFVVNNATEYTADIDAIYVAEDSVFSSIKILGSDVKSTYLADATATIKGGVIIAPVRGSKFSGLQLTSGSVVAILK
tara:strand:- start:770 stop:1051 length:282 start_codon:yes stop_codon:yes gene_type:complete